MKTFVWEGGKPKAMRKHNDDLIMACAIGCWVKETVFSVNQREVEYKKAFINSISSTTSELNTSIPGMLAYREKQKKSNKQNYKDFVWLIKG
jgi:asparagine synthetase A